MDTSPLSSSIKRWINDSNIQFSTPLSVLQAAVMAVFRTHGFVCIGIEDASVEDDNTRVADEKTPLLPTYDPKWNADSKTHVFRVRHAATNETILITLIKLDGLLLVNAVVRGVERAHSCQVTIRQHIDCSGDEDPSSKHLLNLVQLHENVSTHVVDPLTSSLKSTSGEASSSTRTARNDDDYESLRNGPEQRPSNIHRPAPGMPFQPSNPSPASVPGMGIGDKDLFPAGAFIPNRGGVPAFSGGRGGGGSQVGPNDPMFGHVHGPASGGRGSRPPPGARYDPIGPFGVGGGVPNPDHLRRPGDLDGYGDMFF